RLAHHPHRRERNLPRGGLRILEQRREAIDQGRRRLAVSMPTPLEQGARPVDPRRAIPRLDHRDERLRLVGRVGWFTTFDFRLLTFDFTGLPTAQPRQQSHHFTFAPGATSAGNSTAVCSRCPPPE